MVALVTVVLVMLLSLIISRVATVAFVLTGLSREAARFQARSALSGTGFTTTEAESIVNHPVRRKVVMVLMLLGSAGLVTVVASVMLSFARAAGQQEVGLRLGLLVGGLLLLWFLARNSAVERRMSWVIARALQRWTDLDARDYGALLHLSERYEVGEVNVREGDWVAGRTLGELRLRDEGVVVLGITTAEGGWIGSPVFDSRIEAGDTLIAYGPGHRLAELDGRRAGADGEAEHERAIREHHEALERTRAEARAE